MNRNVVLIVLDTVRKDHFDKHATELQERADLSIDECRAASAWSVPSHASMMTGELPHQHGIHAHNIWDSLGNREVVNPDGLDPNTPRQETDTIPETEHFESGIIKYKRLARENNGGEVNVDTRTENRLRDLGYL